jgi:hypothetical protein
MTAQTVGPYLSDELELSQILHTLPGVLVRGVAALVKGR